MDPSVEAPRYWMIRLCKLADAIEAAEARRLAAQTPPEHARAETELDAAFKALYRYYLDYPFQIRLTDESWAKAKRLVAAWSNYIRRMK